jgi:hypothetical protein
MSCCSNLEVEQQWQALLQGAAGGLAAFKVERLSSWAVAATAAGQWQGCCWAGGLCSAALRTLSSSPVAVTSGALEGIMDRLAVCKGRGRAKAMSV